MSGCRCFFPFPSMHFQVPWLGFEGLGSFKAESLVQPPPKKKKKTSPYSLTARLKVFYIQRAHTSPIFKVSAIVVFQFKDLQKKATKTSFFAQHPDLLLPLQLHSSDAWKDLQVSSMRSAFHRDVPFGFAWSPGAHRNRPPGFDRDSTLEARGKLTKVDLKRSAFLVGFG